MRLNYCVYFILSFVFGLFFGLTASSPSGTEVRAAQPVHVTDFNRARIPASERDNFELGTGSSGYVEGYVADIRAERAQKFYEVYLIPPQAELTVDYRSKIFNPQLTLEFNLRYREKFGYIDNENLAYAANRFTQLEENRGRSVTVETKRLERRAFAEYMMRRLGEWHVDNYFKSDPAMRQVYELKEKMSNVQVEVGPSSKIELHYSFSDNSAEFVLQNPYCDSKLRIEMDPTAFGPSQVNEQRLYVGRQITKTNYLMVSGADKDGIARVELWNNMLFGAATSLSVSTPFKDGRAARESSIGAGVLHSF